MFRELCEEELKKLAKDIRDNLSLDIQMRYDGPEYFDENIIYQDDRYAELPEHQQKKVVDLIYNRL